ncbi:hypothetical protein [Bacillus cereus]|uniref:hypothetical protein n=1 Tax=Bacillus cereus TaxID=1396 RepID=UPI00027AC2ED|nr:hypothetical protein [Bacillus cereus]EJS76143.1 hypothetical protein ICY_02479 [Bacillus cereus BAG2X1-3]
MWIISLFFLIMQKQEGILLVRIELREEASLEMFDLWNIKDFPNYKYLFCYND